MTKRTRWQPPYPDPNNGTPPRPGDNKPRGWRMPTRKVRCRIAACDMEAAPEARNQSTPLCYAHISEIRRTYAIERVTTCTTCEAEEERRTDQAERRSPDYIGTVYYLQVGDAIKIGWTSHMWNRMRQYPPNSVLLAYEDGPRSLEKSRHGLFNEYLAQGREWFEPGEHLMAWINQLRARHGDLAQYHHLGAPEKQSTPQKMKQTQRGSFRSTASHDGSAAVKRPAA